MNFTTKDSGNHKEFKSGMKRDINEDKPRFDLITPKGQAYTETLLYRWAMLMMRGAKKYSARNWEQANSQEDLDRFMEGFGRHSKQYEAGETDEDHAAAVLFNLTGAEYVKDKLK